MTSRIGARPGLLSGRRCGSRGFTLIELILVMAVLASVAAISAPRLKTFLEGGRLKDEARRLLALVRHARNEAMANGVETELWIDPEAQTYGMRYLVTEASGLYRPLEFSLDPRLSFEVEDKYVSDDGEARIAYWPDGSVDADTSLERLRIWRGDSEALEIAQAESLLEYVIEKVDVANPNWTT